MSAKLPQVVCLVLAMAIFAAAGPLASLAHGSRATTDRASTDRPAPVWTLTDD
ncbi:hypothetical protein AB7M35_000480 [Amorphus suaedae]